MKYRICPNKDLCRDYHANNCDGCALGEKFTRQARKIKNMKSELAAIKLVAASLANELNMTDEEFDKEVKAARQKVKERKMTEQELAEGGGK